MVVMLNKTKKRKYQIQKRTFKDAFFFNAWFNLQKPEWSEWEDFKDGDFDEIDAAYAKQVELNKNKQYFKHKVEYRLIKNE